MKWPFILRSTHERLISSRARDKSYIDELDRRIEALFEQRSEFRIEISKLRRENKDLAKRLHRDEQIRDPKTGRWIKKN